MLHFFVNISKLLLSSSHLLITILIFIGLYFIFTEFIVLPTVSSKNAINSLVQEKTSMVDLMINPISNMLEKYITLDDLHHITLENKLVSAGLNVTPEHYIARSIASGISVGLFSIPMAVITPVLSIACLVLGIVFYFVEYNQVDNIIKKKREKIEGELSLFANTIKQSLANDDKDILSILTKFSTICGEDFKKELDMTISDILTGNLENALKRFDERVSSAELSEIVSGLLAVTRGDDQTVYFEILSRDLTVKQRENLKRQALKRPEAMKPVAYLMMFSTIAILMYGVIVNLIDTLKSLF